MRKVRREDILDYVTYAETRDQVLEGVLAAKAARRVHVGEHLTFLFENTETVRYQIQEMMRVERIVKEADIRHEIDTYNEVLGGDGELGATLLVEIDDEAARDRLLREWRGLPAHLYAKLDDETKVRATFDARQVGEERLSSVQYVKFSPGGRVPKAIGCDHSGSIAETALSEAQRAALTEDLA